MRKNHKDLKAEIKLLKESLKRSRAREERLLEHVRYMGDLRARGAAGLAAAKNAEYLLARRLLTLPETERVEELLLLAGTGD